MAIDSELKHILAVVRARPNGVSRDQLLEVLRERWPNLMAPQLDRYVAGAPDRIREVDGLFFVIDHDEAGAQDRPEISPKFRRFVALDLESVVRPTVESPYREQHVFQIGAVRFGPDQEWVNADAEFSTFVQLPEEYEALIHRDDIRERYLEGKVSAMDALDRLRIFCQEADVLVAYNGMAHDFPLLEREYERAEAQPLFNMKAGSGPLLVDGLYLSHALWPIPPRQHRLRDILDRLNVDIEEMTWHDALDDSKMLIQLLEHAAQQIQPAWDPDLLALIMTVAEGSDAWSMLTALNPNSVTSDPFSGRKVDEVLGRALRARPPVRLPAPGPDESEGERNETSTPDFSLSKDLLNETGRIDIRRLVTEMKGPSAEPRASQREMVVRMREALSPGRPLLIEAPTGVGKSYAILAVALDWLNSHPDNRVVISTFTKQLQSQLADDIEQLNESVAPGLIEISDMVKGARNRLSLRALVVTLSDLAQSVDNVPRRRRRANFRNDVRFRELVIYLTLRFIAQGKPTEEWEARSVDRVDIPAFFDEYCPDRLGLYLAYLSQADAGDFSGNRGALSRHTAFVSEALRAHRLVVANHALLLAHLDDLADLGERTLLVVDEAHELENAATAALAASVESGKLEKFVVDAREWLSDQPASGDLEEAMQAVFGLEQLLDDERLYRAAIHAFGTAEPDPLGRNTLRTITVASPLQGDAHLASMEDLARELRDVRAHLIRARIALSGVSDPPDLFESDRLAALRDQVRDVVDAVGQIVSDVEAVLAPADVQPVAPRPEGVSVPPAERVDESEQLVLVEFEEESDGLLDLSESLDESPPDAPDGRHNRVVWGQEISELHPGSLRGYRFELISSPIDLGSEPRWRDFLRTMRRTQFVSATLRVAGQWNFIRERLALDSEVAAVSLDSPFDPRTQARLICFEDFPSWAEHDKAAMRTIAHQVGGYAREVIDTEDEGRTWDNGALVLTTSRAAAAGIFDHLARQRVATHSSYPLISAGLEGNQRAVESFKRVGGVVVGTRGLWQGVDVADPNRLSMVWINKLPFASFTDPVISARRELVRQRAEAAGAEDPDAVANEDYYLPLAALALRQAVGRLIRSREHRGVVIISDRRLAGPTRMRRLYRRVFLESLDPGFLNQDPESGEPAGGNVMTMAAGWQQILSFFAENGVLPGARVTSLLEDEVLSRFVELPETLAIRGEEMSLVEEAELSSLDLGTFANDLLGRCERIAGHLQGGQPIELKPKQVEAITALAHGKDLLAVLPTGYGKSFVFQLPALALPGVTIVVSPLVSLMTDQALSLNRTIGGKVRALVAPMRESNSRTGKSEVEEQLRGVRDHGIKLIYLSPERLCQRQFQDWIRAAVKAGIVRRVAIDEAHTFVQWADDFRPNLRRAEQYLRSLKADHSSLRILAMTGTANESVREGLRRSLFGLEPNEEREDFAFVTANPLRPELALYRRVLPSQQGGPQSIAGLLERVIEAVEGHAIFYCLTVRQVDQVYAHLSDHLQGHPVEVLKYHGRLSDVERTAVANRFKVAPGRGEEGYRRMVVVATSAFGLGIDRPDIRTVFCVSPPTDLAALYQQLGRGGRDRAARPHDPGPYTAGLVAIYPRARRTLAFMTRRQIRRDLLLRMAAVLLNADSHISVSTLAEDLVAEDLQQKLITEKDAADPATFDTYETALIRVFAELSARGLITDLGDFPSRVAVRRGDCEPAPEMGELVDAILAEVDDSFQVDLDMLYDRLDRKYRLEFSDHGGLWSLLLQLHTLGYLDISQWPNRGQRTSVRVLNRVLPSDLGAALERRQKEIDLEVTRINEWLESEECANEGLRHYFAVDQLPSGTCAHVDNRCSRCWSQRELGEPAPKLLEAFMSQELRPASATGRGRKRDQDRLDQLIRSLLWNQRRGLAENLVFAVLRGDDHYFSKKENRRKPLWPSLLLSRVRGTKPGLRKDDVTKSLLRLEGSGDIIRVGGLWRLRAHVDSDEETSPGTPVPVPVRAD